MGVTFVGWLCGAFATVTNAYDKQLLNFAFVPNVLFDWQLTIVYDAKTCDKERLTFAIVRNAFVLVTNDINKWQLISAMTPNISDK